MRGTQKKDFHPLTKLLLIVAVSSATAFALYIVVAFGSTSIRSIPAGASVPAAGSTPTVEEVTLAGVQGNLSIDKPAGTAPGDLLVLHIAVGFGSPVTVQDSTWNSLHIFDAGQVGTEIHWKIAGPSEPSSYTITTGNQSTRMRAAITRITGHDFTDPIHVFDHDNGNGDTATSPSITTTVDNALILRLVSLARLMDEAPSNITLDYYYHPECCMSHAGGHEFQSTQGETGTAVWSVTADRDWDAMTLAIAPYEGGKTTQSLTVNSNSELESGLVGHWTFDEKDMYENVADRSGQGNHGYLTGFTSTTTIIGKIGQALEFDENNTAVSIPDDPSLEGMAELTIAAWMNPKSTAGRRIIMSKGEQPYKFRIDSGPLEFVTNGVQVHNGNASISTNVWTHVAVVYDGSTVTTYINGTFDNSTAYSGGATGADANNAFIGAQSGTVDEFFGQIDDARIYNRALSADDVKRLYELGATTYINTTVNSNPDLESGLVGHWTFDGRNMYENVADASAQGNHGYLQGQTSTTTAIGRIGQALRYDGTDDHVIVGDVGTVRTVAFWARLEGGGVSGLPCPLQLNQTTEDGVCFSSGIALAIRNAAESNSSIYVDGVFQGSFGAFPEDTGWHHLVVDFTEDISSAEVLLGKLVFPSFGIDALFEGLLDDVRIYNRVLSAEEVNRLYELGSGR